MIKRALVISGLMGMAFSSVALEPGEVFTAPYGADLNARTAAGIVAPESAGKDKTGSAKGVTGLDASAADFIPLRYPIANVVSETEGTIEFKYFPKLKEAVAAAGGKDVFVTLASIKSSSPNYPGLSIGINVKNGGVKFYVWVITLSKDSQNQQIYREYALKDSEWQKVTVCWSMRTVSLYYDDKLISSMERMPQLFGDKFITIGGYGVAAKACGLIADFKIYDKAIFVGELDRVVFDFPGRKGKAELARNASIPIKENLFAAKVETDAPAIARISSGVFKVSPGQGYAVNFSDRPVRYLTADNQGVLNIELEKENNYCSFTVIPCDIKNLLSGVEWFGQSDAAPKFTLDWGHEGGKPAAGMQAEGNVGTFSRDPAVSRSGSPSFKIEKTAQSGEVSWKSKTVQVKPGQEYLFSGWYHLTEPNFGATAMFRIILPAAGGNPEKMFQQVFINPLVAPLYGTQWRYVQSRFKVPDGYSLLYASLSLRGAPQTIWWDDINLQPAPALNSLPPKEFTEAENKSTVPIEQVRQLWKDREPVKVEVKTSGSFPVLYVNNKPIPSLVYNNYVVKTGESEIKRMMGTGIKWYYLWITPSYTKDWWVGKGKYDFSEVRKSIEQALAYDPDAVIMLEVKITPEYREWGEENPDAVWRDHDGRKVAGHKQSVTKPDKLGSRPDDKWACSYGAEDFRTSVASALRDLIKNIKSFECGKAVAGINFHCGTDNQWFPHVNYQGFDFATGAEKDFRIFLKTIYGNDVNRLRQAWGMPEITFETAKLAPFELRTQGWFFDPKKGRDRWIIDSNRYNDIGMMQTANYFGKVVKEEFGRNVFVNLYSPDIIQGYSGRSNQKLLFDSNYIDGFISVPDYGLWRISGRTGNYSSVLGSYGLHGKIILSELDYRTHAAWMPADAAYQIMIQGGVNSEQEFLGQARRDIGALAAQGQGGWFLAMNRILFSTPKYVDAVRELAAAMNRAAAQPMPDDRGQMGVFIDDEMRNCASYDFSKGFNNLSVGMARITLNRSGVTWDAYNLADLENPKRAKYKVNLFLSSPTISAGQIEWVKNNLQKDGNVVVFVNAAGMCSDKGSFEENVFQLTGIKVKYAPETSSYYRIRPAPGVSDKIAAGLKDNVLTEFKEPLIYVDDPGAIAFGEITGTGKNGWAVKRFKDWTSVYISIAGAFTPELLRNIVREAGIEPLGPCNDVTSGGNGFITIHALSDGSKTLRWQNKCDLVDLASGEIIKDVNTLSLPMKAGETRWFRQLR